jgi:hypothetical protein
MNVVMKNRALETTVSRTLLYGPRTSLMNVLKSDFKKIVEITHWRRNAFRSFFSLVCVKLCSWFYFSVW